MTKKVGNQDNGRVVVKSGYHVTIQVPFPMGRGRHAGYWRSGVTVELKEWLDENVGTNAGQHEWELKHQGNWIHTGVTQSPFSKGVPELPTAHFWFRDLRKAQLFVLSWKNRI